MQSVSNVSNVNFGSYYNYSGRTKTQRFAIAASSFGPVAGLGQVINGENAKGIAFFLGNLLNTACFIACGRKNKIAHIIGGLAIRTWSAIDAYKRA